MTIESSAADTLCSTKSAPPQRQSQLRSTITRQKLLDAARAVFAEKGYMATEVADIVQLVPITKGALYHHFGGKETLFQEVCKQISRQIHEASSHVVLAYSGDAWWQLLTAIQVRFDIIVSRPDAQRIVLIDGPSVLGWQRWREIQAEVTLFPLQQTLDILIKQGRIPDQPTGPVAQLILAALNDAALTVACSANPPKESARVFEALSTLINGLRFVA